MGLGPEVRAYYRDLLSSRFGPKLPPMQSKAHRFGPEVVAVVIAMGRSESFWTGA